MSECCYAFECEYVYGCHGGNSNFNGLHCGQHLIRQQQQRSLRHYQHYSQRRQTLLPVSPTPTPSPSPPLFEPQPLSLTARPLQLIKDYDRSRCRRKASKRKYKCTWKGCKSIELTSSQIERHIRTVHLGQGATEHEEDFYYTEIEDDDDDGKTPSPTSPPTLSHRDMARPPHEDPEYQRQFVGHFKQGRAVNQQQQHQYHSNSNSNSNGKAIHHIHNSSQHQHQLQSNSNTSGMPTSPLAHHNYTWPSTAATITNTSPSSATSSPTHTAAHYQQQQQPQEQQQQQHNQPQQQNSSTTFIKHARSSPRPSQLSAPYPSPTYVHHQHHNYSSSPSASSGSSSSSHSSSTIQHSNSSANTVLQQLSQQNVTVTAHHNGHNQQQSHQQQQHTLSAITITPNYQPHQQMRSGQQQSPSVANGSLQLATTSSQHAVPHMSPASSCSSSSQHQQQLQPHAGLSVKHMPNSPNRRTRGENKKCRKVYGMERKDQWCTQCRWKKACSRFND